MNDLVLPKQEEHGGYVLDSIGIICNSSDVCIAMLNMSRFGATGLNDLVLPKQEEHGGYVLDSIAIICNSSDRCTALRNMKSFADNNMKNEECKPDAFGLIKRYGSLL